MAKKRNREKRRQQTRKQKRRKLLAGAFREEWLDWPLIGACMTSQEFWRICGQTTLCACRENQTGGIAYATCEIDLFRGGIGKLAVHRAEEEANFDDAMRAIADTTRRRVTAIELDVASRLLWGVYALGGRIRSDIAPTTRRRAPFFPQPEGDHQQWAEALHGEWKLIAIRLLELAETHQVEREDLADQPAMVMTTLTCRVSDTERLVEFLDHRTPEITGGPADEPGLWLYDYTGPVPSLLDDTAASLADAQRLLAQASLKEDQFTMEGRAALWVAQFYEMIARSLRDVLTIDRIEWRSFRDILPP